LQVDDRAKIEGQGGGAFEQAAGEGRLQPGIGPRTPAQLAVAAVGRAEIARRADEPALDEAVQVDVLRVCRASRHPQRHGQQCGNELGPQRHDPRLMG
jgi:hypothetical protein